MKRILIMEDNTLLATEWRETLELNRFLVKVTHSGDDAARALNEETFDLVITDLFVGGKKGGLWVITTARKMGINAPPVIAVTGASVDFIRGAGENLFLRQAIALGAVKVLEKPFSAGELAIEVQNLLD